MIIQKRPNSRTMKMTIRHEWFDFRVLFLLHDVFDENAYFTIEEIPLRKMCDPDKTKRETIGDAIMSYFRMNFADSWDNAEIFIDRESVTKRIDELSKQSSKPKSVILKTMLTMFCDKIQYRKDFQ